MSETIEAEAPAATLTAATLPPIGAPLGGGFFAGLLRIDGALHALVVSPALAGTFKGAWHAADSDVSGASSCCNGLANTRAMAEAGSVLARTVLSLRIDGYTDWHIPARDALEMMYRHLKPTTQENYASFRDGDNPSSVPAGYPYTEAAPGQTAVAAFQEGGAEALAAAWHWSSTQCSARTAWIQHVGYGDQSYGGLSAEARARAVRTILIP